MDIKNQVCSPTQAKKLKELGIIQKSQFIWRRDQLEHIDNINSWSDQETMKDIIGKYDAIGQPKWRDVFQI